MKIKEYLVEAQKEMDEEKKENVICAVKESLKRIKDCKKTLKELEKNHEELLDTDVEEFEEWEY